MVLALVLCHVALALALSPRAPRAAPRRGGATNAAGASDGDDSDYRRRAAPDERSAPRRGADDRGAPRRGSDDRGAPRRGYDDRSAPRRGSDDRGSPRRGPDDRRRESDDRGAPRRGPDDRGAPRRDDRGAPRRGPPPPRESWAVRRLSGDSAASQARNGRAKKWETRGDALYQASTGDAFAGLVGAELEAAAEAMLLGLAAPPRPLDDDDEDAVAEAIPSTVAWGGVSVGPVLLPRLLAAQIMQPTPIQRAAFDVIARGDAALIVSETGSGKTLAFLVPLLARLPRSTPFQALLVCPSAEVAQQTQRAVDALWPPDAAGSAVHVAADADALEALALRPAPLIAGTPAALHALLKAAKAQSADERRKDVWHVGASDMDASVSSLLMKNLRAVVVDEVDQLLDTAAHAAFALDTRKAQPKLTACEALLRSLPWPKAHEGKVGLQLICASASVGRVLRRQLQQITGAASVDAAAALVTAGARRGTCPETLDHVAALWGSAAGSAEAGEGDRVEAVADAIFAAMAHLPPRATIVFATKSLGSTARIADALKKRGLGDVSTLGSRKPAAFDDDYDGAEVADLKALLRERKLSNVGGKLVLVDRLRKSDAAPSDDLEAATDVDADAYAAFKVPELKDLLRARELKVSGGTKADLCARLVQDDRRAAAAAAGATPLALGEAAVQASWASTPVFVANDKFARGLDMPLGYAFLTSPPATAALYLHQAGRVGRCGAQGTAVTLVEHSQVPRLASFAADLGIRFKTIKVPPSVCAEALKL